MKKNKKGFTLVELLVSMAIFTILFTALFQVLKPTAEITKDVEDYQQQRQMATNIINRLEGELKYADDLIIINDAASITLNDSYIDYSIIEIDYVTTRTVKQKTANGIINFRDKITLTPTNFMPVDAYDDFSTEFEFSLSDSGKVLNTDVVIFRNTSDDPAVINYDDKFEKVSSVKMVNMCLTSSTNTIKQYSTSMGTSFLNNKISAAPGKNTYIIYHENRITT